MKLNRSLAISSKIQECKRANIIGLLEKEFPTSVLQESPSKKSRNRIFTLNNTLLTMVLTATQTDKTLSVRLRVAHCNSTTSYLKLSVALTNAGQSSDASHKERRLHRLRKTLTHTIGLR